MSPAPAADDDDAAVGPRAAAWHAVQQALDEGKPKTALERLRGIEAAAGADKRWDEVARAIATRVLAENGDRPPDDPARIVQLAEAIAAAPPETRGVLAAIRANWTWSYFQMNRWRYQQRTRGGAATDDVRTIAEWDLPGIVAEIRRLFTAAVGAPGSPERAALQKLPVAGWSALIPPGKMPDTYRPTVWDVVVRDAIEFAGSGERGLVAPEDAFEILDASPALAPLDAFLAWRPEDDPAVTDREAPLLDAVRLHRELLDFHAGDADRTALLAADLDRILWASDVVVPAGDGGETHDRKQAALERFIERAGGHETASLARFHLASLVRQGSGQPGDEGDWVEARRIAAEGAAARPGSPGGAMCRNLVGEIEARELALATERSWAAPWPVVRVTYRNIAKVHLKLVRADWRARLAAGKPQPGWIDDDDRRQILSLPAVRQAAVDLPATDDFRTRFHDVDVGAALDAAGLEPGGYWVIASHKPDFGAADNVVHATGVWVTRLGIVSEQSRQTLGPVAGAGGHRGHVVDLASGEPVAGATVSLFLRERQGPGRGFLSGPAVKTDREGSFAIPGETGREAVLLATAELGGRRHEAATDPFAVWNSVEPDERSAVVLVTDRGIHRPGQIVFYKGIACASNVAAAEYRAVAGRAIDVVLRDANGREVAKSRHVTTANGSFHGSFPLATGALPGQWSIMAQAEGPDGFAGGVGVRVEEYKRPKFLVKLAAPADSVALGGEAKLVGTATTYTGVPVAGAKVRWRVERTVRFPIWCRWFFPWLPFDAGGRRIARGTAVTGADGTFTVPFPLIPDRAVPRESLPVFSYSVVADVTDPSGETRGDERTVRAGYTDVEATVAADAWQAVVDGRPAAVKLTIATTTLDGEPRAAAGTLTVSRLVQPAAVARPDYFGSGPVPGQRGGRRGPRGPRAAVAPRPPTPRPVDPANPATWAAGEAVVTERIATDAKTGKAVATATLPAGVYKAVFEIPAAGNVPAVRSEQVIEVVDPQGATYGVRRGLALLGPTAAVEPGREYAAVVGTGYDTGRALVEISRSGRVLERFWTAPGRTQWPVRVAVKPEDRGGFTVRAWLVRDGRLHVESRVVDVPWTDRRLTVEWDRFRRRVEPGAKEVWRARIRRAANAKADEPLAGVELVATLYDQSLDSLAPHVWPDDGLLGLFRRESGWVNLAFTNSAATFSHLQGDMPAHFVEVPPLTYRELRDPFGTPQRGGFGGFGGMPMFRRTARGGRMEQLQAMDAAPMAAAPPVALGAAMKPQEMAKAAADKQADRGSNAAEAQLGDERGGGPAGTGGTAAAPPPRRNLVETAFFLPSATADAEGVVTIEFTVPDTLTTWQFKGLAHDRSLASGTLADECVSAKDLMVEPVLPRFLREGDVVRIPVKVTNTSAGRLAGTVRFELADARTGDRRDALVEGPRERSFDLAAGESRPVEFTVKVADGTGPLTILAAGSAGKAADGEESLLPVLARRVLVRESVPVTIRGPGTRKVAVDRLLASAGTPIESQSLVVQATGNPAWLAVLALPSILEETDESTETLFTRLYANGLARHLATSDPRIARVFAQWRAAGDDGALASPLEKNADLVKTLLAETPWVREAVDEREARGRIALLFDENRAAQELEAGLARLAALRNPDGGWPWFPGGQTCDSVTLGILAGLGRLRAAGLRGGPGGPDLLAPALETLPWLDRRLVEEKNRAEQVWKDKPDDVVLTPIGCYALYARSFFRADRPPEGEAAAAVDWAMAVGKRTWMKVGSRMAQGHLAIALARLGEKAAAASIIQSLAERAVDADVPRGVEKESWQGMWWRDPHPGWWSWSYAPIATQAIMIEAFDEVAGDAAAVEALKVWLLSQKRTSRWPGSRSTADAVGALLGRGHDLLGAGLPLAVTVAGEKLDTAKAEAGTGFLETRFVRREIQPGMGAVEFTKPEAGLAFGGVHWQYLDDIARVPAAGREELAIEKKIFVKRFTKAGPQLEPADAAGRLRAEPGDEIVVRLVVKSDHDYEFLEIHDHRASLTEPVDVLSGWRWGDGAGWYVAIRDASTQLFFERLPRGTHVFEYALRAAHRGTASAGFATIQSRYAPEFSARSASPALLVE